MDLLWQKDSKNVDLYANIFKGVSRKDFDSYTETLSATTAELAALKFNRKDDELSSLFRNDGNTKFKAGDWLEAMDLYNQSLCFAGIGSENASLAYANRSACFLQLKMYSECLVDIELAKQANYPTNMMPKLDKRREDCLKLMNTCGSKNQLSYECDEKFPGLANVLEIRFDEKFGRHIIAKCDIPAGRLILADKAFVTRWINMRYSSCAVCARISTNVIACSQCTTALFCSNSECANNESHRLDCGGSLNSTGKGTLEYYLGAVTSIINTFPNVECLMELVESAIGEDKFGAPAALDDVKSKIRALLQLSRNQSASKAKTRERLNESLLIYNCLSLRKSIQKQFDTDGKKRFLMHLVLHLNCVMINNGFNALQQKMTIYIISSYFNHSCAPNVIGKNSAENVRYCRSVRPIKAGQQLFISYVNDTSASEDHDFLDQVDTGYRQRLLYENFGFRCKCERCVPNMMSWQMNAHNMQLDRFFQWMHRSFDSFLNSGIGTQEEKAAIVEKKVVDLLNRFGDKHWCDELAGMIATYETFV